MTSRKKMNELRADILKNAKAKESQTEDNFDDIPLVGIASQIKKAEDSKTIYYCEPGNYDLLPYPDAEIRLDLHTEEKRASMVESIKTDGILEPILVWRQNEQKYILAGHNRYDIGKELQIKIPYIEFSNITKEQADRIVIITNLQNRQYTEMKPSQLAVMLKRLVNETYGDLDKKDIVAQINEQFSLGTKKIYQYLRYNQLIKFFLDMLDSGCISLYVGYQLGGVNSSVQEQLHRFISENQISSITMKQIDTLFKKNPSLWNEDLFSRVFGLNEKKIRSGRKPANITIKYKSIEPYCANGDVSSEFIVNTLKLSKDITDKFEKAGIKYDEQLLLDVVDNYLLTVKNS